MFVSRVCLAASSAASRIVRPVLQRVVPASDNWPDFAALLAIGKIDFQAKNADELIQEHEKKLLDRVKDSVCFLYRDTNILGGAEATLNGNTLGLLEIHMKPRFLNKGHELAILAEIQKWSNDQGLQLVQKDDRGTE